MRCEVIAIGTELLLGQIIDTNSAWIAEQLALAGIDAYFQTRVGDNLDRIASVLRIALERSDAVILCGGLGPTQDDITREAIARVMGVPLVRDTGIAERIRALFTTRGRVMPENNLRQADIPLGTAVIPQMPGTAPGLICPLGDKVIYAVPGVPYEMREMVLGTVIPDLRQRSGMPAVIKSRTLRTWGHSESGLAERLAGRISELDQAGNPTLAFLASGIEGIKVRITAKAASDLAAEQILNDEEAVLRGILGDLVFGVDAETMEVAIVRLLNRQALTLGVVESLTGGLVSARLTAAPGASAVFRGAIVAYGSDVQTGLLGVPEGPVASAERAETMALGACRALGSDIGLAAIEAANSIVQEGQSVGTVFLGLAMAGKAEAERVQLPGDPERIRQFTVVSLLNLLRLRLLARD